MASVREKFLALAFVLIFSALAAAQRAEAYERIISLYPGHTDNVAALGAGAKLIGISENDREGILPGVPRFSMKAGPEALLALRPDLVLTRTLADSQNPELKKVLERAGVRVEVIDPPKWEGFEDYLRKIAELAGTSPDEAVAELAKARAEISDAAAKMSRGRGPLVFVEATARELHTCSPDSWAAHLVALAGGRNAAAEAKPLRAGSSIAPWGLERVLETINSGLDVYLVQQGPMNATDEASLRSRPWSRALENVKTAIVPEYLLSRPSLSGLKEGGAMLIKIFYGE
ncbi:ABC transporter substrate-binding protein [Cloacibacillus sp. An23]|uniref:ABC transporter substrate-binding protein n=1 Tax=Cloacibacillus sp. An23 TaxID=1965591 RepID=UPI000B3A1BC6|nr:ABC transporter substrate-binding protein [Cloacibacillus sp. An23]OUO94449.1 hypothetical protein B5F39_04285 [Cloacibacillus sp. An23]